MNGLKAIPRRKRQLLLAALALFLGVTVTTAGLFFPGDKAPMYQPGQDIEGITAELSRTLPAAYDPIRFTDVTTQAGIDFRHFSGTRSSQLPEDMGSGAAWGDFDRDEWPDLFVANLAGPLTLTEDSSGAVPASSRLYRSRGDGTFEDVTARSGIHYTGWVNGAAWGDYDSDGRLDLVLTTYGPLVLYRNRGDGTFEDTSSRAGFDRHRGFWAGAAWADYDRDGRLDLYVSGYVAYRRPRADVSSPTYDVQNPPSINPSSFPPIPNLLFKNLGNGRFEERARQAGVANPEGRSLSATWADFDEDGWLDLYVANDVSDNVFYRNLGDGGFEDISHAAWVADYRGAMGIAVGDWDGDLDLDMAVTHWIAQENALYVNQRRENAATGQHVGLRFVDEADRYGIGQIALDFIGWAVSFVDLDNDGRLDLFVSNGSTLQDPDEPARLEPMRSQVFWNAGPDSGFFDVSAVSGDYFATPRVGRGAAFADYDRDGDLDLFLIPHDNRATLLRNEGGNRRHWFSVRLAEAGGNTQAVGAFLSLVAGGRTQIRQVGAQASYLSQNDLSESFGLGAADRVDTLEVRWPDGTRSTVTDLPANQHLTLAKPVKTP